MTKPLYISNRFFSLVIYNMNLTGRKGAQNELEGVGCISDIDRTDGRTAGLGGREL
jgi:hypothetical protein